MNQTVTGKAYEYALAQAFSRVLSVEIAPNDTSATAKDCYGKVDAGLRRNIDASARIVAEFLADKEGGFAGAASILIQTDAAGRAGDVRDLIIKGPDTDIGISAKHNNATVKNSRLSPHIDFGMKWGGYPVSDTYWKQVAPVFTSLEQAREEGKLWKDIVNKAQAVYLPVLAAFEDEFRQLCETHPDFIGKVFSYIIGRHDFYKAVCSNRGRSKSTTVEACNLNGGLAWGTKRRVPNRVTHVERKRGSTSTLHVSFDGGWELSFRLHNARTIAEPSLKFDIRFTGMASNVARHTASH